MTKRVLVVTSLSLLSAFAASAQEALPGFTRASALRQDTTERRLVALVDTASVRRLSRALSAVPHVAGTPAQAATRDSVMAWMRSWGLETWVKSYAVYIPRPDTVAAWIIRRPGAAPERLALGEPRVPEDPATAGPQVPPYNGYTGYGDVAGEVVFAGFGLPEDFRTLDSLGVSVRGRVVIARYGRSFRGIKAREAEQHGAAGLILYTDPEDDGYRQGDVYPDGPMRPAGGIQRGAVRNGNGDPTTPGYASVAGARRVPFDSLDVPRIPVIPMGYGNARRILEGLRGTSVPQDWQGALPFRYHVGPGPMRVRLKVTGERGAAGMHEIWNTFGLLRGERFPDEWVIAGAHRDAWTPGAEDNVSGTVSVLEAARALAALARQGIRPARSILFATWDAEEWGLIGSIEWVEEMEDSLLAHAVAYINEDGAVGGSQFGGGGSPSLKPLFRDAARAVPAPRDTGSVYDGWWRSRGRDTTRLTLGNLGGGSDFQGFYHHLGIPSGGVGFDGPAGIYHSMYDSYHWMSRYGDPGYLSHRALAGVVGVILSRLANAEIVPLDYAAWGRDMRRLVGGLDSAAAGRGWTVSTQGLRDALDRFTAAGVDLSSARDAALAASLDATRATAANRALRQVERRLTRPEGLVSRPWYRSLQFASDLDRGYATMAFPSVGEAIRYADAAAAERELRDLAARIDEARAALAAASAALR